MSDTIKRRETMRATMAPDVYSGPDCDQHTPRWIGSADGDMDGDGEVGTDGTIRFAAHNFPPGTVITVSKPECPKCGCIPQDIGDQPDERGNWSAKWECECDFDWRAFTEDRFS